MKKLAEKYGVSDGYIKDIVSRRRGIWSQYITLDDIVGVKEIALDTVYDIEVEDNHNYYLDCGNSF